MNAPQFDETPATWQRKSSDGAVSGPFALDELAFLARRGKLRPDDLVREAQAGAWTAAYEVAALSSLFNAQGPKLPAERSHLDGGAPIEQAARPDRQEVPPPTRMAIAGPIAEGQAGNDRRIVGASVLGGVIVFALLFFLLLFLWRHPTEPEAGESGSGQLQAPAAPTSAREPAQAGEKQGENALPAIAQQAGPKEIPAVARNELPPQPVAPAASDGEKPAVPTPTEGSPKPVEAERHDNFISAGALTSAVDRALSGKRTDQPRAEYEGRGTQHSEDFLRKRGGDLETENAVNKGLEWLAKHQAPDGSWSLNLFAKTAGCKCSSPGTAASDTAATALGLLPFLGAGEIFAGSKYHSHAGKALAWLLEDQKDNGSFRHDGSGNFYAHALATLALCETYGMTDEGALRSAAQQALDYIIAAQHAQGGWRYDPGMPGDLSVTGWQVMALRSGQIAHLSIPSKTLINADNFLDHVQCNRVGSTYGYLGADSPTPCRTAIGLLAREYLGWKKDNPGLRLGSNVLLADLPSPKDPDIYYWYYGTLVMHHLGGVNWHRWNEAMKAAIVPLQVQAGHETGSWTPASEFDRVGGRLYMTALAVCTLEVYYRYLPLYRPGGQPNGERNKR